MKPDFDSLVERHQKEIFIYLWRILGKPQDAEDCLQDTFLKAYQAYDRFQVPGNPRAWLYRIAMNTAFTRLKETRRDRDRIVEQVESLTAHGPSVSEQAEIRSRLAEVSKAVDKLPPRQRAALIMRKYQEMSYPEIGEVLDCTTESARANVYQALRKLRLQFDEHKMSEVPE